MRVLPDIDDTQCPLKGFERDAAHAPSSSDSASAAGSSTPRCCTSPARSATRSSRCPSPGATSKARASPSARSRRGRSSATCSASASSTRARTKEVARRADTTACPSEARIFSVTDRHRSSKLRSRIGPPCKSLRLLTMVSGLAGAHAMPLPAMMLSGAVSWRSPSHPAASTEGATEIPWKSNHSPSISRGQPEPLFEFYRDVVGLPLRPEMGDHALGSAARRSSSTATPTRRARRRSRSARCSTRVHR